MTTFRIPKIVHKNARETAIAFDDRLHEEIVQLSKQAPDDVIWYRAEVEKETRSFTIISLVGETN